ncbi:MAG: hypothetical protein M1834_008692 [Cirrosporium novae-zelandiae]|nr:MAG: hypothetical protein M1834_008692 [Cirrosporium novae-zelandiae]
MQFKKTELFGGAITVDFPEGYADVSTIRQVPDHQEVYLATNGFSSIIVELNQRVPSSKAATDAAALKYHLDDLNDADDKVQVLEAKNMVLTQFPAGTSTSLLLATTSRPAPRSPPRTPIPKITGLILLLVRLIPQETDVLVTVNLPYMPGEFEEGDVDVEGGRIGGRILEDGKAIMEVVVRSLEVRDWGLFGSEQTE